MEQWTEQLQSANLLKGYRAEKFIVYTDGAKSLTEMEHCWLCFWMEQRLNVKMKRSKKRCRLGVEIPDRLFFLLLCR